MLFRMKTTLILPDSLVLELKRRATDRRSTLSAVVAEALRRGLEPVVQEELPPLPSHAMGQPQVDVADRDALHRAMEGI